MWKERRTKKRLQLHSFWKKKYSNSKFSCPLWICSFLWRNKIKNIQKVRKYIFNKCFPVAKNTFISGHASISFIPSPIFSLFSLACFLSFHFVPFGLFSMHMTQEKKNGPSCVFHYYNQLAHAHWAVCSPVQPMPLKQTHYQNCVSPGRKPSKVSPSH